MFYQIRVKSWGRLVIIVLCLCISVGASLLEPSYWNGFLLGCTLMISIDVLRRDLYIKDVPPREF